MRQFIKRFKSALLNYSRALNWRLGSSNSAYAWKNVSPDLLSLFSFNINQQSKVKFMMAAIKEARKSTVNPTVGAVIVKNNEIVGRGYRQVEMTSQSPPHWKVKHAEQVALNKAGKNAEGATLYVTLEPCYKRYQGPTVDAEQVCSKLIPKAGIVCVVIGLVDKDPMTCGKGIKRLKAAGLSVEFAYKGIEDELLTLVSDGHFGV